MRTSSEVGEFLDQVVGEMSKLFGISQAEGVARVNQQWAGRDMLSENEIILHEDDYYWALFIYFDGNVPNWDRDADRSEWSPRVAPSRNSEFWTS
jgi:hypothetical protein